jgi:O-antigen ligase
MSSARLLYIFIFAIPFLGFSLPVPVPLTAIFTAIFAIQLLMYIASPNDGMMNHFYFFSLFLLVWLCISHVINTVRFGYSPGELRLLFGRMSFAIIVFITYCNVRSVEDYAKILRIFSYSVLLLSGMIVLFSIFDLDPFHVMTRHPRIYWGISMPFHKTSAIPISYGELGIIAISAIPALLYSLRKDIRVFPPGVSIWALMLIVLAIFISQSRNAWVSVIATVASVFLLYKGNYSKQLFKVTLSLSLILTIAVSIFLFGNVFTKFIEGFISTDIYRANVFNRLNSYTMGMQLFLSNMMIGIGSSNVAKYISFYKGEEDVLHNAFIDQIAGTGLFGFIPFILLFAVAFYQLMKISKSENQIIAIYGRLLMSSFIGTVCALQFYRGFLSETLAVEYGLLLSLWKLHTTNMKEEK